MATLKSSYSTAELAQALEISPCGFEANLQNPQRPRRKRDEQLSALINPIFKASRQTYGSPRLTHALRAMGQHCGKNRIARLMKENGIKPVQKRRFRPRTTDSRHNMPIEDNRLPNPTKPF